MVQLHRWNSPIYFPTNRLFNRFRMLVTELTEPSTFSRASTRSPTEKRWLMDGLRAGQGAVGINRLRYPARNHRRPDSVLSCSAFTRNPLEMIESRQYWWKSSSTATSSSSLLPTNWLLIAVFACRRLLRTENRHRLTNWQAIIERVPSWCLKRWFHACSRSNKCIGTRERQNTPTVCCGRSRRVADDYDVLQNGSDGCFLLVSRLRK